MRHTFRLGMLGAAMLAAVVIVIAACRYFRIEPLPDREQLRKQLVEAEQHHEAQRLRDVPSLEHLPEIEPMTIEQALILGEVGGLFPGTREANVLKPWNYTKSAADLPSEMDFRVDYVSEKDAQSCRGFITYAKDEPPEPLCEGYPDEIPVTVEVRQFPNEAWALYMAKWSPMPNVLKDDDPDLDIARVTKFKNRIVLDRQWRSPDETGVLLYFWASGQNLVCITYSSKGINEEFLRRYLVKYPSSL